MPLLLCSRLDVVLLVLAWMVVAADEDERSRKLRSGSKMAKPLQNENAPQHRQRHLDLSSLSSLDLTLSDVIELDALSVGEGNDNKLEIDALYCFGDSNTDTGNFVAAYFGGAAAVVGDYGGRSTNGRNHVDFLSDMLGLETAGSYKAGGTNFAWGSATTNNEFIVAPSYTLYGLEQPVPSVQDQILFYLENDDKRSKHKSLFLLWSGYNDYLFHVSRSLHGDTDLLMDDALLGHIADEVTSDQLQNIQTLVEHGGAKRILVFDLADLTQFPDAVSKTDEQLYAYRELHKHHNTLLRQKLELYLNNDSAPLQAEVRLFSVDALFQRLIANPSWYGFLHSPQEKCLEETTGVACTDPYEYMFYDVFHPSTKTHLLIAQAVLRTLLDWNQK